MTTNTSIDFRYLAESQPSICIPRIFSNIDDARIRSVFAQIELGVVHHVDIIERKNEKGETFKRAYVHFSKWLWNENAQTARRKLIEGKEIKIVYDNPWFWKVSANRATERRENPVITQRLKPHVEFDDDSGCDEFGRSKVMRKEQDRAQETRRPDYRAQETRRPDYRAQETRKQETRRPETRKQETRRPDNKAQETRSSDNRAPETRRPDYRAQETRAQETRRPDYRAQETRAQETRRPDYRAPEARKQETREYIIAPTLPDIPVVVAPTLPDIPDVVAPTLPDIPDVEEVFEETNPSPTDGYVYVKQSDDTEIYPTAIDYGKVLPIPKKKSYALKKKAPSALKQVVVKEEEEEEVVEMSEADKKICEELYGDL